MDWMNWIVVAMLGVILFIFLSAVIAKEWLAVILISYLLVTTGTVLFVSSKYMDGSASSFYILVISTAIPFAIPAVIFMEKLRKKVERR